MRAGRKVGNRSGHEDWFAALGDNTLDELNFKRLHRGGMAMLRHRQNHTVARRGRRLLIVIMLTRMIVRIGAGGVRFFGLSKLLKEMVHAVRRRSGKKQ